ncbi:methyltransferase family protein [Frankia sp. EI5c]|uniref:class I SAM-dependent methyltransferase n=1 Tax=Frankia sp. EI5c TaxID=683316 RepID=UPI0007C25E94|nr:class I SAM-dependent methyltransferase [Frankia sp. EI5c]OAA25256.1 methyltransferase family protein [Frankia sp. EI5c]
MSVGRNVRRIMVESPNSLGARSRGRRWERVREYFPSIDDMRVVDLGGTVDFWLRLDRRPARVVVINLEKPAEAAPADITVIVGDACDPPPETFTDQFDLVFSNSVIEHVGGHAKRLAFAEVTRRLAPLHWVQTPNRYFPLEPHWLFPGFQFLPVAARASVAQHWPLAHTRSPDRDDALRATMSTELIGRTELRSYFPDSEILDERTGPLTKSIIAVRGEKPGGSGEGAGGAR